MMFTRDGQGSGWTVILEIFTAGGGKNFFDHFFPFYKIWANFFAIFKILSSQFEIFMGVPAHRKPFKIFMMGVRSKFTMGVPPHHPPLCPSLMFTNIYRGVSNRVFPSRLCEAPPTISEQDEVSYEPSPTITVLGVHGVPIISAGGGFLRISALSVPGPIRIIPGAIPGLRFLAGKAGLGLVVIMGACSNDDDDDDDELVHEIFLIDLDLSLLVLSLFWGGLAAPGRSEGGVGFS